MRLPIPESSYAVLIGTTTYSGSFAERPLPAVAGNVTDLAAVLTDEQYGGFLAENCTSVLDEDDRNVILRTVRAAAARATDVLLVYLSGHAAPKELSSNELLLPLPGSDDLGEDFWWNHALPYGDIRKIVRESRAACRMVVIDTCFSGRALAEAMGKAGGEAFVVSGSYVLASAGSTMHAVAPAGARHTAFTGVLIDLLTNGIDDPSPELSLPRIFPRLRQALLAAGYPEPDHTTTKTVDQKALVRNRSALIARDLAPEVITDLGSDVNTIIVRGLRRLEDLHDQGTRSVRDRVRSEVVRFLDHDSKIVSQEAGRLYDLIRAWEDDPGGDVEQKRPERVRRALADPWLGASAVILALLAGTVLWWTGLPAGLASAVAAPLAVLGYAAAIAVAVFSTPPEKD
ncbi:caspase family protein [Amycolatopsis sp. NPDC049252]|uniref:caspase, EACC1-associated type n=1 Tax=Amycolatopsis sp. NPDC049252 TaxID=3363933 RepID=UPI0037134BF2